MAQWQRSGLTDRAGVVNMVDMIDMAAYMQRRRDARRVELKEMLGGKCVGCGTTEDLEFHHKEPATKLFSIGQCIDTNWDKLVTEAKKCELLCGSCHDVETIKQLSVPHGGGASGKKNCPCIPCKSKKAEYMKQYKRPHPRRSC